MAQDILVREICIMYKAMYGLVFKVWVISVRAYFWLLLLIPGWRHIPVLRDRSPKYKSNGPTFLHICLRKCGHFINAQYEKINSDI